MKLNNNTFKASRTLGYYKYSVNYLLLECIFQKDLFVFRKKYPGKFTKAVSALDSTSKMDSNAVKND